MRTSNRPLTLVLALAMLGLAASAAAQEKTVTLKFAHWVPVTHPLHSGGAAAWGAAVEQASGGSIKVEIYPASQLGKAADHYDMARDGIADVGWLNAGFNPGRWPIASAGMIPMLFADAIEASAALTEWYAKYASTEMGDVKFCLMHNMHPGTVFSKNPIKTPDDFKGVRYRPTSHIEAIVVRNHGGTIVNVPQPEIREVLRRGVADATFNALHSVVTFGIYKEVKYVLDLPWGSSVFALVINKPKYESLSPRQRGVIDAHCTPEWAKRYNTPASEFEKEGTPKLKEAGLVFYKPSAEEMKAWRAAAAAAKEAWAKEVSGKGGDPEKIYGELTAALKKHKALLE
jgi:TRAP-type C4-dicarboxylate transport system substrate-binding protein